MHSTMTTQGLELSVKQKQAKNSLCTVSTIWKIIHGKLDEFWTTAFI